MTELRQTLGPNVQEVRGRGLLIGIEFFEEGAALFFARALLERGYLVLPAGADARTIQLSPPLNIDTALLDGFKQTLLGRHP